MLKYMVGDKVKVKVLPSGVGTIIAASESFYVVEFIDQNDNPYCYSYSEEELVPVNGMLTKCECGAVYTWAPLQHAFWCPRYYMDK